MAMTKNGQKSGPIRFSGETLVGWVREPQHFKFTSAAVFEPGVGVPVVTRNLDVKQRLHALRYSVKLNRAFLAF